MVSRILLARKSQKENPNAVLADGLLPYVRYGREYLEKSNLSSEELNKVRPAEVASLLRELKSYPVRIQYYGPELPELKRTVGELLPLPRRKSGRRCRLCRRRRKSKLRPFTSCIFRTSASSICST